MDLARSEVSAADRPRVLHVFGSLALGGIETWIVHMLRHKDDFSVRHEVLLTKAEAGPYEVEVRALGIPVHRVLTSDGKASWARRFAHFLGEGGPFAAVHSHPGPHFTALALQAAKRAGVPIRIAHSHSARSQSEGKDYPLHLRVARRLSVPWLKRVATRRIGITDLAIREIAGSEWRDDPAASVLIYGFDFSKFRGASKRGDKIRSKLGIPTGAPVIGHVGRFEPVKNHALLIEAFETCAREVPDSHLVLVGKGRLEEELMKQVRSSALSDRIHFAGTTEDVPAYMAMFDLFALPSFSEGLGIVVVEAQAAGTRTLVSETTPAEASVVPGAVEMLPLAAGAEKWGQAMARLVREPKPDAEEWLDQVEASRFGIRRCIDELDEIYRSELERTARAKP
jgi:glycosyltransferase involved in cell wall biosynthesis